MLRGFAQLNFLAVACASQIKYHSACRSAGFVSLTSGKVQSSIAEPIKRSSGGTKSATNRLLLRNSHYKNHHRFRARAMAIAMSSSTTTAADLPYRYQWPRPAVTVDCIIYTLDEGEPWILLIKRKNDPFKGAWALPGGFVDENEGLDTAARRELEEETGVTGCAMVQTGAYGDPGRDPRGHTITVAFMAWAPSRGSCNARAGDDAAEAEFFPVKRLPSMAFDHFKVIADSWARCRFQGSTASSPDSAAGEESPLSVVDRSSGKTLGMYTSVGLELEGLEMLRPTEVPGA